MKRNEIKKDWLINQGIEVVDDKIYRTGLNGEKKLLTESAIVRNHKLGKPLTYYIVSWYDRDAKTQRNFLVHRLIYAWNKGICPDDVDIDHKDGDPSNNKFDNLQAISHKDNMKKRPGNGHNDSIYYGMYGLSDEEVDELSRKMKETKTISEECCKANSNLKVYSDKILDEIKKIKKEYKEQRNNLLETKYMYSDSNYKVIRYDYLLKLNAYKDMLEDISKMKHDNIETRKKAEMDLIIFKNNLINKNNINDFSVKAQKNYIKECDELLNREK